MDNQKKPTFGNGKICYIEIPALDINQSANFYAEVFGWKLRHDNDGSIAFDDGVGEVSGTWVTGPRASTEPGLMVSILVHNIAETVKKLIARGGKLLDPIGTTGASKIANFSDPAGNIFCLYEHPLKENP
jgi:predicted enzyme related to lactoylglutathione lyase